MPKTDSLSKTVELSRHGGGQPTANGVIYPKLNDSEAMRLLEGAPRLMEWGRPRLDNEDPYLRMQRFQTICIDKVCAALSDFTITLDETSGQQVVQAKMEPTGPMGGAMREWLESNTPFSIKGRFLQSSAGDMRIVTWDVCAPDPT